MVAVVERGEFCGFLRTVLFFLLTIKVIILTVRKVLIRGYLGWPFVLQFSSSPFDFISSPLWVPSLARSISMTLRQI